ncbi:hypothetical protein [uncultured Thomasclavelia sp.]|uniref:hypothetical protein n=1 Tax=uncultured Thomasclavelia sp. TaxID=3025759 RepID=UPI0025F3F2DF|nr:hypothetical protein [uncultured Thomasclavelia sp.]
MRKLLIILIIMMNVVTVDASGNDPKYKIIANSNSDDDIEAMYETKDALIADFKTWAKGVDDIDQVLADHQKDYQAKYYNGEYTIVLGEGQGKELTGSLKTSYCVSSKEIKKKSFFASLFS